MQFCQLELVLRRFMVLATVTPLAHPQVIDSSLRGFATASLSGVFCPVDPQHPPSASIWASLRIRTTEHAQRSK
jgi:hypothetical protein